MSDNASTDETPELCAALASEDDRVRAIRHPQNIGATANFNAVVEACRGDYVVLLADDDWLAPDYVEACLAALRARPQLALACGRASYYRGDAYEHRGEVVRAGGAEPSRRVLAYVRAVGENATFYGLMPAHVARAAYPLQDVIGGDWLLMARVALAGEIETVETTTLSRSLGGASENTGRSAGLPRALAPHVHVLIGWALLREIGWASPAYARLGGARRLALALRCQPPLARHWLVYVYAYMMAPVVAHPSMRRLRPVTRLRGLRDRATIRGRSTP